MSSRNGPQSAQDNFQQQGFDQGFDQVVLGDAAEALGRVGTGDGGGSPGAGVRAGTAVPINFKELVVLARRGMCGTKMDSHVLACACVNVCVGFLCLVLAVARSTR